MKSNIYLSPKKTSTRSCVALMSQSGRLRRPLCSSVKTGRQAKINSVMASAMSALRASC
ncbi:MAG: hypothetical protein IT312_08650 [Anaerolineales bacterium]|nr:hypothetical protein [Anaerolineales bacterium]